MILCFVFVLSNIDFVVSKLIVIRKNTGDEVYGGSVNCSHGSTYIGSRRQCVHTGRAIGIYISFC